MRGPLEDTEGKLAHLCRSLLGIDKDGSQRKGHRRVRKRSAKATTKPKMRKVFASGGRALMKDKQDSVNQALVMHHMSGNRLTGPPTMT